MGGGGVLKHAVDAMTSMYEIRADYDARSIVIYQAYNDQIADAALAAGLNTVGGSVVNAGVATAHDLELASLDAALV